MYIKAADSIKSNYNEIATLCKETGEPVHLTVNGEGDLVVMDMDAFYKRERILEIREQLLAVEIERTRGVPDYPAADVIAEGRAMLRKMTTDGDNDGI